MRVRLLHTNYSQEHLETVKNEMLSLGAPEIRGYNAGDEWFAIEGCHRLRAAHELGIEPVMISVEWDDVVTVQNDGDDEEWVVGEFVDTDCQTQLIWED